MHIHRLLQTTAIALVAQHQAFGSAAYAEPISAATLPRGGVVTSGSAAFGYGAGNSLNVMTGGQNTIVDWQSFSIGSNAAMNIQQPSSNAAILNRVVGQNLSEIYGKLNSNGQVMLVNPNGIVVANGAVINTNGLVLSTLDIDTRSFLGGANLVFKGDSERSVQNLGMIKAGNGDVFLVSRYIDNQGSIQAPKGTVGLAAGGDVIISPQKAGEFGVRVKVGKDGSIDHTGKIAALKTELIATSNPYGLAVNVDGLIDSGDVKISGKDIALTKRAVVDASNLSGNGGTIALGQKGKTETVKVATGAKLKADGAAKGGTIINWADKSMDFAGDISAKGQKGGFAEVSAKENLNFTGTADLRGANNTAGTFLLDPNNIEITSGAATLTGASTINPTTLTTILNANTANIVVHTTGSDGEAGDIQITNALNYTSTRDLTFLAHRHIVVYANVQNGGTGNVNAIAGWDGTTGSAGLGSGASYNSIGSSFDISPFAAERPDLATPTRYGLGGGNIIIEAEPSTIGFGSRNGATNLFGYNITVTACCYDDIAAMIGYRATTGNFAGDINLSAVNNIAATAGINQKTDVQIGHGGRNETASTQGNFTGNINLYAGNNLSIAGGYLSYAQVGHGGVSAGNWGNFTGNITANIGNDISVTAGTVSDHQYYQSAHAQIGHGGISGDFYITTSPTVGNFDGAVSVYAGRDITLTSDGNFAHIGSGGTFFVATVGDFSGDTTVDAERNLLLTQQNSGNFNNGDSFTMVGQGGLFKGSTAGNFSGDLSVTSGNNTTLTGLNDLSTYGFNSVVKIGQGGVIGNNGTIGDFTGDLTLDVGGNLTLTSGNVSNSYATTSSTQVGRGAAVVYSGYQALSNGFLGQLNVNVGGNVTLNGGQTQYTAARIGDGGLLGSVSGISQIGDFKAPMNVIVVGDITMNSGSERYAFTQIGHGGYGNSGTIFGNFTSTSDIFVSANNITMNGGTSSYTPSVIGHGGVFEGWTTTVGNFVGDLTVNANSIALNGGAADYPSNTQIGQGGVFTDGVTAGNFSGNLSVTALNDIILTANTTGAAGGAARIGQGGDRIGGTLGDFSGNLNVSAGRDIILNAGYNSAAQIGQGGYLRYGSIGNYSGDLIVSAARDISLNGFANGMANSDGGYAQIGQGGLLRGTSGDFTGNATVTAGRDLALQGGDGFGNYAQVGQGGRVVYGGMQALGNGFLGNLTVNAGRNATLAAGAGEAAYAMIGVGGILNNSPNGIVSGVGIVQQGNILGDVSLTVTGDLNVSAGTGLNSYALVGAGGTLNADPINNGSTSTRGTISSDVSVLANNITVTGNTGDYAYAMIGVGGLYDTAEAGNTAGAVTGSVITKSNVNTTLIGGVGADGAAKIFSGGDTTIIVDNAFPAVNTKGTGAFSLDANSTADGAALRIYTSERVLNTINGTLNGGAFTAGAFNVDTATEKWGTTYDVAANTYGGTPYTLFYKEPVVIPPPPPSGGGGGGGSTTTVIPPVTVTPPTPPVVTPTPPVVITPPFVLSPELRADIFKEITQDPFVPVLLVNEFTISFSPDLGIAPDGTVYQGAQAGTTLTYSASTLFRSSDNKATPRVVNTSFAKERKEQQKINEEKKSSESDTSEDN